MMARRTSIQILVVILWVRIVIRTWSTILVIVFSSPAILRISTETGCRMIGTVMDRNCTSTHVQKFAKQRDAIHDTNTVWNRFFMFELNEGITLVFRNIHFFQGTSLEKIRKRQWGKKERNIIRPHIRKKKCWFLKTKYKLNEFLHATLNSYVTSYSGLTLKLKWDKINLIRFNNEIHFSEQIKCGFLEDMSSLVQKYLLTFLCCNTLQTQGYQHSPSC